MATPLLPNGRPSTLSLREISLHCGESPFARGLKFYNRFGSLVKGAVSAAD